MKKIVRFTIIYPLFIYLWLLVFLFISQKSLIYFPDNTPFEICNTFETSEFKTYKETKFYQHEWINDNVIVFFHWNAWRACDRSFVKSLLQKTNSTIIFTEYYGYSDESKSPNFKSILKDVENIWEYINNKKYENIYVVWRSIWTWPASYFTQKSKTDKLLLISPYSSLYKIWSSKYPIFPIKYLFTENYEPEKYLNSYKNELLIIHGEKDQIVPTKFWKELYNWIDSNNKRIKLINNWTHNNILWIEEIQTEIVKFLN